MPSCGASPTSVSSSPTRLRLAAASMPFSNTTSGSAMMSLTRQRALRLAKGSWKIIWKRLRSVAPPRPSAPVVSEVPSNRISPALGSISPTISLAMVDLPEPDSPTSAKVSPLLMVKETSSTAFRKTLSLRSSTRLSHGLETSKVRERFLTSRSGAHAATSFPS
jgi:hypothetical protein